MLNFLSNLVQQSMQSASNQGSSPSLSIQGFGGGQSHRHVEPMWLISATQSPAPNPEQNGVHHKPHCQDNNRATWPKLTSMQTHSYLAKHSKGSEVISQEPASSGVYLEYAGLEQPRPAELTPSCTSCNQRKVYMSSNGSINNIGALKRESGTVLYCQLCPGGYGGWDPMAMVSTLKFESVTYLFMQQILSNHLDNNTKLIASVLKKSLCWRTGTPCCQRMITYQQLHVLCSCSI